MLEARDGMRLIVLASILAVSSMPTSAQTIEQKNVMQNIASLVVAVKWCEDYQINKEGLANIAILSKTDVGKEPSKSYFEARRVEYEELMGKYGVNAYCAVTYKRFGPGGVISGLMMKK